MLVLLILVVLKNKKIYADFVKNYKEDITLPGFSPFAFAIIDKLKIYKKFPKIVNFIHQKMIILKGSKLSNDYTKIYLAKVITLIYLMTLMTLILVELGDEGYSNLVYGAVIIVIVAVYLVRDLEKKVKERRDAIILEMPEFLNKVILLVNAGDTIQGAMKKSVLQNRANIQKSPLYFELNEAVAKLDANVSFQEVMKDLSYRCSIQEVSVFTTTVMMNYRKGGALLVESLKELSVTLWDKRKTLTRVKGEEASSKLIFPIMLIFVAILLIVAYPAIAIF
ncbi:type II secretion system F family protein [Ornithinibacillus sp. 4-3]|uniref:Type II secretion system F family protein n=1 Tax=Ornithinibacillus sp. 4-3 TaxID=3231488 RepID=A0AB39HP14_9BACI